MTQLVVFRLDERRSALLLALVERAVRAVEETPQLQVLASHLTIDDT